MTKLSFKFGVNVGNLSGAVVGKTKRFYCLFGDAINMAARLSSNPPPDTSYAPPRLCKLCSGHVKY
jgi:class 3 adenylate cyclase